MALRLNCGFNHFSISKLMNYTVRLNHDITDFRSEYKNIHIPTTALQKVLLTLGASAVSLLNPARGDMIATLGETTGHGALYYIRSQMEQNPEGTDILRLKPRINSKTVDIECLSKLPEGTLGKVYYNFLVKNKVTPDSRLPVKFVDDTELAYVMQRYREVHDLFHAVLNMPTNMLGEVTVKWIEGIQTTLPMCVFGGLFGAVRLAPKQRQKYVEIYLPWAIRTGLKSKFIMNTYFERRWEQPLSGLHEELHISPLTIKT